MFMPCAAWTPGYHPPMRILVLGGYGLFGSRISRTLAGDAGLTVIIAGRSGAPSPVPPAAAPVGMPGTGRRPVRG